MVRIKYLAQNGKTLSTDGYNGAGLWPLKKAAIVAVNTGLDDFDPAITPDASGNWLILMIPKRLLEAVESRSNINSKKKSSKVSTMRGSKGEFKKICAKLRDLKELKFKTDLEKILI